MQSHFYKNLLLFSFLFCAFGTIAKDRIPFRFVGNLLLVKANLNGQVGEFILDTGAPELMVNQAYFKGVPALRASTEIVDLNGHSSEARYFAIDHFSIGSLPIKKQYALTVDLSSVERTKGIHLLGIIGYAILKDLELIFDFDREELTFAPAQRKSAPLVNEPPIASFGLKFSGHVPYLIGSIGKKKFRLGIDTGAEINLLDDSSLKRVPSCFDEIKKLQVKGISHQQKMATSGILKNLMIGEQLIGSLDVTIVSLHPLNESLAVDLDGILGMPFLRKGKVGVSYKKRRLWVWEGKLRKESQARMVEASISKN
ncbi:MAG: aspartyl protease family protein [Bacteroidota bacterium]